MFHWRFPFHRHGAKLFHPNIKLQTTFASFHCNMQLPMRALRLATLGNQIILFFFSIYKIIRFSSVLCIFCSPIPRFQSLFSNAIYCLSFIVLFAMHDSLFLLMHLFFSFFHPHYISVILSFFFYYGHALNFCKSVLVNLHDLYVSIYLCVFLD
jgi:hypothetical protein